MEDQKVYNSTKSSSKLSQNYIMMLKLI